MMASCPVYLVSQDSASGLWQLRRQGCQESPSCHTVQQLPSFADCFLDHDTQFQDLVNLEAGLLSEEHAAPDTILVASGLPEIIGADDETAQSEINACDYTHDVAQRIPGLRPLTGASNHEAGVPSEAVQQEEVLHPAIVASGGAPLRDCFQEGDCFGSPALSEIPQLPNQDNGRVLEEVTKVRSESALAPVIMPLGSPPKTSGTNMQHEHQVREAQEEFELGPTRTPKLGSLIIAQQTTVGLEQAPPEQMSPLPSPQALVGLDEASPLVRALPAEAAFLNRQPLASEGLKHGANQAEKHPSTPVLKGPALPSCFRMDDSTPTKSPNDSAPDYFPSPEMTQKDAERPLFQGQAGRKPFAAPQIRSFSRGSGLILPTTDVHQPEKKRRPPQFQTAPSKHAAAPRGQRSPLPNQQPRPPIALPQPWQHAEHPSQVWNNEQQGPPAWQSRAGAMPEANHLPFDTRSPIHTSMQSPGEPPAVPSVVGFQNLRTGKTHTAKRSDKAARVHALLDEVLEADGVSGPGDQGLNFGSVGMTRDAGGPGEQGLEFGFTNGLRKMVGFSSSGWAKAQNVLQAEVGPSGGQGFGNVQAKAQGGLEPGFAIGPGQGVPSFGSGGGPKRQGIGRGQADVRGGVSGTESGTMPKPQEGQGIASLDFGFMTGSGKKVGFSCAGWEKAQALLAEENKPSGWLEHEVEQERAHGGVGGVETGPPDFADGPGESGLDFGFTTGTGKKVGFSTEAWSRAQTLLQEEVGPLSHDARSDVAGGPVGGGNAPAPGQLSVFEKQEESGWSPLLEKGAFGPSAVGQGLGAADMRSVQSGVSAREPEGLWLSAARVNQSEFQFRTGAQEAPLGVWQSASGKAGGGKWDGTSDGFLREAQHDVQEVNGAEEWQGAGGRVAGHPGFKAGDGSTAEGASWEPLGGEKLGVWQTALGKLHGQGPRCIDGQNEGEELSRPPVSEQRGLERTWNKLPMPQADGCAVSFRTGSMRPLPVAASETERGRAFFGDCGGAADFHFGAARTDDVSIALPMFGKRKVTPVSMAGSERRQADLGDNGNPSTFSFGGFGNEDVSMMSTGFRSGNMKPVQGAGAEGLARAKRLLDEDSEAPSIIEQDGGLAEQPAAGDWAEPLRLGWRDGTTTDPQGDAKLGKSATTFSELRKHEVLRQGEPMRLGGQGGEGFVTCQDQGHLGSDFRGFDTDVRMETGRPAGGQSDQKHGASGDVKLARALSCWDLDTGSAAHPTSDPKPLNPGVQHLRNGGLVPVPSSLAQQRLHQSGPRPFAGVQGLGSGTRQPLATIGRENASLLTPGNRLERDKPRKLKFDSPRPLSASRPRPPNKSPLPGPSAFKSPYIGRAPSTQSGVSPLQANSVKPPNPATPTSMLVGYGQPCDSFQQTTPAPPVFQGLSPFSALNPTPFQAYTPGVTPQTTGSPFRFDMEEARQGGTPLVARDQASASPLMLHMGDPKQEMHAMYRGVKRPSLREAFEGCPREDCDVSVVAPDVRSMASASASSFCFQDGPSGASIGHREMRQDLMRAGADAKHATTEWVENHYRWIVWKLASYERSFPGRCAGRMLTAERVLDQLKYRYQREIKEGQRSALKQICEKDQPPSRLMVLCISAVRSEGSTAAVTSAARTPPSGLTDGSQMTETEQGRAGGVKEGEGVPAKVEVTDGWYWLTAQLDMPLTRLLHSEKLRVGQKIKILGASLEGLAEGAPPLEACTMSSLTISINGTHRCRWDEKLGFCKSRPAALPLKRIKNGGGNVPLTVLVVMRIYPMLYVEKLPNGQRLTRSAKAEDIAKRRFEESRSRVVEEIAAHMEEPRPAANKGKKGRPSEGARLHAQLESAADPETLLLSMTSNQHAAMAAYQQQQQDAKHTEYTKAVDQELEARGLVKRETSSNVRVRVAGLYVQETNAGAKGLVRSPFRSQHREGIVTIWRPTDEQVQDLAEGAVYLVSNLAPRSKEPPGPSGGSPLLLNSSQRTKWQRLDAAAVKHLSYTHRPREAARLSTLEETSLGSEFDTAAYVLLCTDPCPNGTRRQQWVFLTDGSFEGDCYGTLEDGIQPEPEQLPMILALDINLPEESFVPVEKSLVGSVVAIANVRRQARDEQYRFGRGAASDVTVVSGILNGSYLRHLKGKAEAVLKWGEASPEVIARAQVYVASVIGKEVELSLPTTVTLHISPVPQHASFKQPRLEGQLSVKHSRPQLLRSAGGSHKMVCPEVAGSSLLLPQASGSQEGMVRQIKVPKFRRKRSGAQVGQS